MLSELRNCVEAVADAVLYLSGYHRQQVNIIESGGCESAGDRKLY